MRQRLRKIARKNSFLYLAYNLQKLSKGYFPILLDYPVDPIPRYGYGKPPHPQLHAILSRGKRGYRETLGRFLKFEKFLLDFPERTGKTSLDPSWVNKWIEGLDTFTLYGFVAGGTARRYIEVGSGYSTKIVRRAVRDQQLKIHLTSIDPRPRAGIDKLCDEIIRQPLEAVDLSTFDRLETGDILFVDNSHRSFMNSDVTVFFLDVLPRLKPGVIVHIHDIYLPYDYYPERGDWFYSEQYLLAASLLSGHQDYAILMPNAFVEKEPDVFDVIQDFWKHDKLRDVNIRGASFWIQKK